MDRVVLIEDGVQRQGVIRKLRNVRSADGQRLRRAAAARTGFLGGDGLDSAGLRQIELGEVHVVID